MITLGLVALGGAIGATLRYSAGALISTMASSIFPLSTLFINAVGSLSIGLLAGTQTVAHSSTLSPLLITGLLGGFTTFSTFSLESMTLIKNGALALGLLNIALHLIICLSGTALGIWISN